MLENIKRTINKFNAKDVHKHFIHSLLLLWTDFYLEGG